jgi:membrane dipeptidase
MIPMTRTTVPVRSLFTLAAITLTALSFACTPESEAETPPTRAAIQESGDPDLDKARRVLAATPLIDGHNDLPWAIRESAAAPHDVAAYDLNQPTAGHTDIARLREGMVGAQFWSVYVPYEAVEEGAARVQLEQIEILQQVLERYPDVFEAAHTAADVERIFAQGKIASLIGMEGGHAIENSLGALRAFFNMGARYMTLTHGTTIDWADSGTGEPTHDGLTEFGREVVREMNWLGMLVDLSHTSPATMHDVLDVAEAPVIYSHSSARALTEHQRNVPDEVLERLPENGGVVMVTFVTFFVNADPEASTLSDVADHIEHVRDVAGIEHVGIGSDYDGIETTPAGLEDVSKFPDLFAELSRRGWSEADLTALAGGNLLRVMRQAEEAAARLRSERGPSTKTIQQLDGM